MMPILAIGSTGASVEALQRKVKDRGFDPGHIDGVFGPATEAAVMAFQKSKGLVPDGIVGPHTLRALDLAFMQPQKSPPSGCKPFALPMEIAALMCPGAPRENIKRHLPQILQSLRDDGIGDRSICLMAVATIRAETARFEPVSEGYSRYNTSPGGRAFNLYDNRRDLGNRGAPDGAAFKGRGFVQLTGRDNYERIDRQLGLAGQLVADPDLANDPIIAAQILSRFLKNVEVPIRAALGEGNLKRARKLVNGGSHGLEEFADAYRTGERATTQE